MTNEPSVEKTLSGLRCCQYRDKPICDRCPYRQDGDKDMKRCTADLTADAAIIVGYYDAAIPVLGEISQRVHEAAMMFRQDDPPGNEAHL